MKAKGAGKLESLFASPRLGDLAQADGGGGDLALSFVTGWLEPGMNVSIARTGPELCETGSPELPVGCNKEHVITIDRSR